MKKLTYEKAGVDIAKASLFKKKIRALVRSSFREGVLKDIGGFGSLFRFPKERYREPVLVSSSDGVGTKLKIAQLANKHDTIGIDLVAMNVNDILCTAAEPLFFLDYIATGSLDPAVLFDVVRGINNGCRQAGCSLIGGETAEMPQMYKRNEYDLAGFCVGVVEKKDIVDGLEIKPGDSVIGIESNGLHSNGFSLVRKAFSVNEMKVNSQELLRPTRIYARPILSLLKEFRSKNKTIKGIAHITGGAFYDKIARILPVHAGVVVRRNSWIVPKIFRLIQNRGNICDDEMYRTFNMGIGMVLIIDANNISLVRAVLTRFNLRCWVIGEVTRGNKQVSIA